jgi:PIN domain nuclease of toxin-antitoxin system
MTYLLDTHVVYQILLEPNKLSERARSILTNPKNECIISAVSFWEISLKYSLGKLELTGVTPAEIPSKCVKMGFSLIDISCNDAAGYNKLTGNHHRDPFDRMLIWQAIQNNYTLISNDELVKKYQADGLLLIS